MTARARGEVIVCGGVFNSPQLLQLSGLGPGGLLRDLGISVLRDMPAVGADLQDHFYVRLAFRCTKPITLNDVANNPLRKMAAGMQYLMFRSGPLATNGICAGGFARSDQRLERPDIQLNFSLWSFAERTRAGVYPHPFPGFTVSAVHLRPDARGDVRLKSADPLAPPAIRFNFLKTQYDLQALTAGMRLARKIVESARAFRLCRRRIDPGQEYSNRRRVRISDPQKRHLQPASSRHLPDGPGRAVGRRSALAGARRQSFAGRRRLRHALCPGRQHQRADDHDRRKGVRHDLGRCSSGGLELILRVPRPLPG